MTVNIVLVEPQIPQNTGNIARTCAATGARLHLVGPMGFVIDDSKLKRAGLDYWHLLDITQYENIGEFFRLVSGGILDGREDAPDTKAFEFYYFTTKGKVLYTEPRYADGSYIIFGSETKGLDDALLKRNPDRCLRLPIHPEARSLNLSNAVAVGVFEVLRQWGYPNLAH